MGCTLETEGVEVATPVPVSNLRYVDDQLLVSIHKV